MIMLALITFGGLCLWDGHFLGLIPFVAGGLMLQGFREPESSPSRVWIITFLGKKTDCLSRSTTMLLDWLPLKIVSYVELLLEKIDHDFLLKKPVFCKKDGGYIYGFVSVSMEPDCDDDPDSVPLDQRKSGAEKLSDFNNAGEMKGIKTQLDDILTSWIEQIANEDGNEKTTVWMETNGNEISEILLRRISGQEGIPGHGNSHLDDVRGLGVKFTKLQAVLSTDKDVIRARNDKLVEKAQRSAEKFDTETINGQVRLRAKLYTKDEPDPTKRPSLADIRKEIFDERLAKQGKFQKTVNQGGINVANVTK